LTAWLTAVTAKRLLIRLFNSFSWKGVEFRNAAEDFVQLILAAK